jgi:glycosyltransferase involved in cell wall biosynthesis
MLAGKRADVRRFYPIFNAFVLPSANEAFGLVVAEALYAGIPCYVFNDAGGPVELISKHEPANICSNPSEMADELFQLSCRKPDENEIIKRKKTAALFSLQKMEESFKQIYLEV